MISKTHTSAQKPRGRQLNAKVCGCESAIFRLLIVKTAMFNNDISKTVQLVYLRSFYHKTDPYHSADRQVPARCRVKVVLRHT